MLNSLPQGLLNSYDLILGEIQQSEGSSVYAKRAFECVLHAFEPLRASTLVEFVKRDPSTGKVDHEGLTIDMIIGACHNLLLVSNDTEFCRFPHLSVREYFEKHPRGNLEVFPDSRPHTGLACISLEALIDNQAFLRNDCFLDVWSPRAEDIHFYITRSSLSYPKKYWHLYASESLRHGRSECLMKLIGTFFGDDCSEPFNSWISHLRILDRVHPVRTGSSLGFVTSQLIGEDVSTLRVLSEKLYCASLLGFDFLIQPLLDKGAKIGPIGTKKIGKSDRILLVKYGNAMVAAAMNSHMNILQMLLGATGSIAFRDILFIMRNAESFESELFNILQNTRMDVSERLGDVKVSKSEFRFPGISLSSEILAAAAENQKAGPQLVRALIDTYRSIKITKDAVLNAAANTESGDKIMQLLLESDPSRCLFTKDVFTSIDVLGVIFMNEQLALKTLDTVLMRTHPKLPLTKALMSSIVRAKSSIELITSLFKGSSSLSVTDEAMHLVAQGSDPSNAEIMGVLIDHLGRDLARDTVLMVTAKKIKITQIV